MTKWWVTNWGNVIGVVGIVLSVFGLYLGFKGWKRKRPTYVIRSSNIFTGLEHTIPDVEVKFRLRFANQPADRHEGRVLERGDRDN